MSEKKVSVGYVCVYEFDKDALQNLDALIFDSTTDEWLDFVMKNRTQRGYVHEYDLLYGPVANDKVYAMKLLYASDVYSRLEQESTKTWHLGPVALYQDFKSEI